MIWAMLADLGLAHLCICSQWRFVVDWGNRDYQAQVFHHLTGKLRLVLNREAQVQNWHHHFRAFYKPKQVFGPAQILLGRKQTPSLDGESIKYVFQRTWNIGGVRNLEYFCNHSATLSNCDLQQSEKNDNIARKEYKKQQEHWTGTKITHRPFIFFFLYPLSLSLSLPKVLLLHVIRLAHSPFYSIFSCYHVYILLSQPLYFLPFSWFLLLSFFRNVLFSSLTVCIWSIYL